MTLVQLMNAVLFPVFCLYFPCDFGYRCPLWSDDRRMNAEAVIHVCKETVKQIKEKNPEIEINADALLPKLPPKTRGPHDDVDQANVLPVCVEFAYSNKYAYC